MKRIILTALVLVTGFLLVLPPVHAEDSAAASATLSAGGDTTLRTLKGERKSAKFEEYRRIPRASAGNFWLNYEKKALFLEFNGTGLAQDDQKFKLSTGRYGKYTFDFTYNQIPHRFAYGAKTLWTGVGTGNLTMSNRIQTDLQASTSAADAATRLTDYMNNAALTDVQLERKRNQAELNILAWGPFGMKVGFNEERRDGTRPINATFGFGNTDEVPEPIHYDTTDMNVRAEYVHNRAYLSGAYTTSNFDNHVKTLSWSNPFRATDSTAASAYAQSYQSGAKTGLMSLAPDNTSNNLSFTGALNRLPWNSLLSAVVSWGSAKQNDPFVAYTDNTAIKTGAVSGTTGVTVPFDAFNVANLPASSPHAKVDTGLMNFQWSANPARRFHFNARYRSYKRDNKTPVVDFPGFVRVDGVWESGEIHNEPFNYKKTTTGADAEYEIFNATNLKLSYNADKTKRTEREVADQKENTTKVSLDNHSADWLDFRASYSTAKRTGNYDFTAPFAGEPGNPGQLPWLRKYDEANRNRNQWQLLASLFPTERFNLTAAAIGTKNNYNQSLFGLQNDQQTLYSLDADYTFNTRFGIFGFATRENISSNQKARQWNPGGVSDPYTNTPNNQPPYDDPSNWTANEKDKVNTVGLGLNWNITPKKLDFNCTYAYEKADGNIVYASAVGGSSTTDNNNFTPAPFPQVDDSKRNTLNTSFKYHLQQNLALSVGYYLERYDLSDLTLKGFANVPTLPNGNFNAAVLMGALAKPYSASSWYMNFDYKF